MTIKEFIQEHKASFNEDKMSQQADITFNKLLKQELHQSKRQKVIYLKYVAVAACFAVVFSAVLWYQNLESFTKVEQELMANLDDNSVGKRLEGIYTFNDDYKKEDARIINRLIEIIHKDENANVKIATIDALVQFPKNEKIRKNLIKALEEEEAPLVQIKLIKTLTFLRENRAQKPLEKIINDNQTFQIVKNNATLAMNEIKK
jgi:HEAT repeat protein|tara:strand:- start:15734 stop:16345 length:612 start_codon:yes stop_codon:yes gene_type:complete